jgi:hypothetical protein
MPAFIMSTEKATSIEPNGSNASNSPASTDSGSKKRGPNTASLDSNGNPKPVKRRAAKACAACRARKVRCDVMQRYHITADGEVTCSNCTMDGIKCVIEESKRRKWVVWSCCGWGIYWHVKKTPQWAIFYPSPGDTTIKSKSKYCCASMEKWYCKPFRYRKSRG